MKETVSSAKEIISELHLSKMIFVICMIIVFWQLNSIKTDLKNVRQATTSMNSAGPRVSSRERATNHLERQVSNLESHVNRIELKVGNLESDVSILKNDIRRIRAGF
jgi:hypothetical protein